MRARDRTSASGAAARDGDRKPLPPCRPCRADRRAHHAPERSAAETVSSGDAPPLLPLLYRDKDTPHWKSGTPPPERPPMPLFPVTAAHQKRTRRIAVLPAHPLALYCVLASLMICVYRYTSSTSRRACGGNSDRMAGISIGWLFYGRKGI